MSGVVQKCLRFVM